MKRERRFLQSEVNVDAGDGKKIVGYAAKFSPCRSDDLGGFVEEILPTAFNDSLADESQDCVALWNHDANHILGRQSAGTLKLSVDSVGLKYEIDAPDTTVAKDLLVSLRRRDVKSSSFGFFCEQDSYRNDKKTGQTIRTLERVSCFDVSPVTFPAYKDATAQVRTLFPDDKGSIPETITSKLAELRTAKRKEKRGRNLLSAVSTSKWAILPEKLETICAFVSAWADGHTVTKDEIQAAMMGFDQDGSSADNDVDSPVCVIPVYGTIGQKMNMMTEFSGGCSTESLTTSFRAALANDSVTSIVFDIDSPGGTVTGVPELAAEIHSARGKKPIVAVANGMAASAAYWIASAADKLVVIPSGDVGSIGVYMTHQDVSAAMDKAGVKMTFIQAGKYKTDGNPYEPASAEFLADAQKGVDEFYEMFINAVAEGRGVTADKAKSDFGQGRMLMAKDALAVGMVDSIQTLDQVVAGLKEASVSMASKADSQIQTAAISAAGTAANCTCMCPQCIGGDHPNCTGSDGTCDYDGDMDAPDDNNDGQQAALVKTLVASTESGCSCLCPECMAGDHDDCSGTEDGCDWEDFEDEDGDEDAPDDDNDGQQAALFSESEANANALIKLKIMQMTTE